MERRKFIYLAFGGSALGHLGWRGGAVGGAWLDRPLAKFTRSAFALGTDVRMTVFNEDALVAEAAVASAFAAIERVEGLMSIYRPDTELSRLNRRGELENPHPDLVEVLRAAMGLSEQTGGAFDVTVQPLWELHSQCAKVGVRPAEVDLREARGKVDWRQVDVSEKRIQYRRDDMRMTLNGIAQGFAADAACRALAEQGITSALIDAGEIGSVGGHARKGAWNIGIKHPRQPGDLLALTRLEGRCLATSGDYETRFSDDFRNHHLFDPHTGDSPTELASVSVAASTAFEADALSTAVFVLGLKDGLELLESTQGADGLFVTKAGRVKRTSGFPLDRMQAM